MTKMVIILLFRIRMIAAYLVNLRPLIVSIISGTIMFTIHPQVLAQNTLGYFLPDTLSYRADIPTPASFFGFQVGEWHLEHRLLVDYALEIAALSDRITLSGYGKTFEQRPLLLLTVTSPENHQHIKTIRETHLQLMDPEQSGQMDTADMPVVVWMGYSVHGNEASGSNAVPLLLYHLAAAEGPEIEALLKNTVILIDPAINPDGLNRFASWVNMHRGRTLIADPNHREHDEPWPSGRTNHYWFDLNRDWLPVQQRESRSRLEQFCGWMPNLVTDFHEMGTRTSYFFQPGISSRINPLIPQENQALTQKIAAYHAAALDQIGSYYFTGEWFDDFYPGKGSTYPDLNGSIGILFEQASARGHLQESPNGPLSFPFAIRNQLITSLSTLKAAADLRPELLAYQKTFFRNAAREAQKSPLQAYVFGSKTDQARNFHLLQILRNHQIRVYELAKSLTVNNQTFEAGSAYVVPVRQPRYRLITSMFNSPTQFQDSLFYDISSWNMCHAFNLPFATLDTRQHASTLLGKPVDTPVFPGGQWIGESGDYAYAFEWNGYYAPRALYRLQKGDIKVRVAMKGFRAETARGPHTFKPGTIVIPLNIQLVQKAVLDAIIPTIVSEDGLNVYTLNTGLNLSGIDLGSPSLAPLEKPAILLVVGEGVSTYEAGEFWHLLDQRMDIDFSMVNASRLSRTDLDRYTAIMMVNGSYEKSLANVLKPWIEKGGNLVAVKRAARWVVKNGLAKAAFFSADTMDGDTIVTRRAYAHRREDRGARYIGGAIVAAKVDLTHPLLYGYDKALMPFFRNSTLMMKPSKNPYATPVLYTDTPLLSGYISERNLQYLKNSAGIIVSGLKKGRVILLADNLNFRSFWYGPNKILMNALFFTSIIEPGALEK